MTASLSSGGKQRDHHRRCVGAEEPAAVLSERHARSGDLPLTAAAAKLVGQLDKLSAPGRADRVPLRQQAAAGVDRCPAAEPGCPGGEQGRPTDQWTEVTWTAPSTMLLSVGATAVSGSIYRLAYRLLG